MEPIVCQNPQCPDGGRCNYKCAKETFPMTVEEAKQLLNLCEREELRDHAFGDREVFWTFDGVEVAGGYFGGTNRSVWIIKYNPEDNFTEEPIASFADKDATELVQCGKLKAVERNDMQGEDIPRYQGA